jgi:hypothetical protein
MTALMNAINKNNAALVQQLIEKGQYKETLYRPFFNVK